LTLNDRRLVATLTAACAAAWVVLWAMDRSLLGPVTHHHESLGMPPMARESLPTAGVLFVAGWVVMTVAMMLPSSVPLLAIFRRLTRTRRDHLLLVLLVVGGYLGVWAIFGVLAFSATRLLDVLGAVE
jgi:predicted metal-binding membrane protein